MSKTNPSDEQLIKSISEGEEMAFDELYSRYEEKLMGFIMYKVRNIEVAQDIFQIVWSKVVKNSHNFKTGHQFSSWLMIIASNQTKDWFKKSCNYSRPQRGVGFLRDSYPFFHHLLHQSEVLCGLYCGFVFYTTTHVLSFFLLTHFERLVLIKRITYLPLLFVSLFFGLTMTSAFSNLELSSSYFISWICIALLGFFVVNFWYKKKYFFKEVI